MFWQILVNTYSKLNTWVKMTRYWLTIIKRKQVTADYHSYRSLGLLVCPFEGQLQQVINLDSSRARLRDLFVCFHLETSAISFTVASSFFLSIDPPHPWKATLKLESIPSWSSCILSCVCVYVGAYACILYTWTVCPFVIACHLG